MYQKYPQKGHKIYENKKMPLNNVYQDLVDSACVECQKTMLYRIFL